MMRPRPDVDPLDMAVHLEEQFYTEGHVLGISDGTRAGRIEGRTFGLEKGFEKFVAMGAMHGKATVWAARMYSLAIYYQGSATCTTTAPARHGDVGREATTVPDTMILPSLSTTADSETRMSRHVSILYALTEPVSLSTANNEEGLADFDDRFRRAQAKALLVERLVGEGHDTGPSTITTAVPTGGTDVAYHPRILRASSKRTIARGASAPKRIGGSMVRTTRNEGHHGEKCIEDFDGIRDVSHRS